MKLSIFVISAIALLTSFVEGQNGARGGGRRQDNSQGGSGSGSNDSQGGSGSGSGSNDSQGGNSNGTGRGRGIGFRHRKRKVKTCKDSSIFVNFGDLPDGTRTTVGQNVDPLLTYEGGTHFSVRNKADNDDLFDDGIIIKNGKTNLQLGASIDIANNVPEAARNGAEIVATFDVPVIAQSLIVLDPDNDPESFKQYRDYGRIYLYGRKGLLKVVNLPENNKRGCRPEGSNLNLGGQTALSVKLGNQQGVVKMVVDTGDGGWKTIDRLRVTAPCDGEDHGGRDAVVTAGPFTRLSPAQRRKSIDDAKRRGKKFSFPECVGKNVEECKTIIEKSAPECGRRIKVATRRRFDFYRIWIRCDEFGKVVGVPRRE